jgi:hypothetical protein
MGNELRVKRGTKLNVVINSQLNPDIDKLDRVELVALGDVVQSEKAQDSDKLTLKTQLIAEHSMWIAARAYGARQDPGNLVIAHTAPIYVVVDDAPTWKPEAVPTIVADARLQIKKLLVEQIDATNDLEYWETRHILADEWLLQRPLLKPRIAAADALYQQMLDKLGTYSKSGSGVSTP